MVNHVKCKNCGNPLPYDKRSNAETCGPNCRKAWSRRKQSGKRSAGIIMSELQALRLTVKKHPELAESINWQLRRIQDEIRDILALRDPEEQARRAMLNDMKIKRS